MLKKIFLVSFFVFNLFSFLLYAQETKKIEVITTIFPTYDFVKQIGKDKVNVFLLIPPGVEPHTFELKPQDIIKIKKSDIFVYTGKLMEPWVEKMLKGITSKELVIVDASRGVEVYENDPHIWLDLANDQIIINSITKSLIAKDPDNKDFYLNNAKMYNEKLEDLDQRIKQTLSSARYKNIIYGGHFVFSYFARRYGLTHSSPYDGFSPNAEPSPKSIVGLINKLKISGEKYIYFEELIDPKVARLISQETGAKLELLHGAHNVSKDELVKGITFIDIMEENLKKLKVGLECQ